MIIPIGDTPNARGVPWVTWFLIAVNVAIYLAFLPAMSRAPAPDDPELREYVLALYESGRLERQDVPRFVRTVSEYDLVVFGHGFRPSNPGPIDALTSMFLHGSLLHLFGNMLFLHIYGDNVERRLGRVAFLALYLGTGFAAVGGDALLRLGSEVPSVGASGAVSGLLGAYFAWFPRNRVRVFVFFFPFLVNVFEIPARIVIGFYVVFDNVLPLVLGGAGGGIAYGAHLGGFVAGLGVALWLRDRWPSPDRRRPRRAPQHAEPRGPEFERAFRAAIDEGRVDAAAALLLDAPRRLTREGVAAEDKLALAAALARAGRPRQAAAVLQRVIVDHPATGAAHRAHLELADLQARELGMEAASYQHLYAVLEESDDPVLVGRARQVLADLRLRMSSMPRDDPFRGR